MRSLSVFLLMLTASVFLASCSGRVEEVDDPADMAAVEKDSAAQAAEQAAHNETQPVKPRVVTDTSLYDTDDPAIWVHPEDHSKSLILGTDKDSIGALLVYDLSGKLQMDLCVPDLRRPNNVDVEYGFQLGDRTHDIAVLTERLTNKIRIYSVPDMKPIDSGGFEVFAGESEQAPMGIALYKRPLDGQIFAIVGRKGGPSGSYLWQYALNDNGKGQLQATKVRAFGTFSGKNEIEAIVVDDQLGYVYYSDEGHGVRKYHADPAMGDEELALFATDGFTEDHEGISIYNLDDATGYILVSDQQANTFRVFPREGMPGKPNDHPLLDVIPVSTNESDGSESSSVNFGPQFPHGIFVAMSDNRTFQIYAWEDIARGKLKMR